MLKYKLAKTSLFVFTIICLFGPLPRALGLFPLPVNPENVRIVGWIDTLYVIMFIVSLAYTLYLKARGARS